MSISLLEQKKKQKFLLPILGVIILITSIVIWQGFFKNRVPSGARDELEDEAALHRPIKINIDWSTLKNPILETLEPFDLILPLQGSYGRKNPFLPY
ncbi:MAG: hypothetical protein A3A08_01000 [Candidatus Nealsonbacteria bacterium RIFCSPLOWO2_01_FULL_41_9]|uniref:Uncharacterized protein n=1 Tax=Candidatus Nealsonbacteria bacterium RIFCSPLOWO2_01_FULL_41_9 TaxID=1801671 RepID=A0A1G2ECE4_9BACT|nr:MAG: hypothetical protein A3A08_01000 [Candidatus Nealsonbacteria bacterium RIFCSPLOWO2_01_FULL_41_9]